MVWHRQDYIQETKRGTLFFFLASTWRQQGESVDMAVDLCLNFDSHRRLRPNLSVSLPVAIRIFLFQFPVPRLKVCVPQSPPDTSTILSLLPECRHNVTQPFQTPATSHSVAMPTLQGLAGSHTEKPRCPLSLESPARRHRMVKKTNMYRLLA